MVRVLTRNNKQQRVVQPLISPRLCTTGSSAGAKQWLSSPYILLCFHKELDILILTPWFSQPSSIYDL